jgi:hypothetical protein
VWATCFLNSPHLDLLEETQAFLTLKHLRCRKNSFQKLTQFSVRNNVLDATVSIVDHFCSRGTCVSSIQLSRTLWTKWPFSTLKCRICSQYSFKNYLNSQENNVPDSAGSNIDGFAWTDPRVFSTQLSRPIGRKQSVCPLRDTCDSFNRINRPKWPKHCMHIWKITKKKQINRPNWTMMRISSPWKLWFARRYSFKNLLDFHRNKKVIDTPASNRDGVHLRDTCVSSTQLNRPIWNKMTCIPGSNCDFWEVIHSKTTSILSGKPVLGDPSSNRMVFI